MGAAPAPGSLPEPDTARSPLPRPRGLRRLFFRFPVWLYRLGLHGWERLFGQEWMLLSTTGRRTGRPHRVLVDVLDYDAAADTYYIVAAYGRRADWVRNIQVAPVAEIRVGRRRFQGRAAVLPAEEAVSRMLAFARRRPRYTRAVLALVGLRAQSEADFRQLARHLLLLGVRPVD